MIRQYLGVAIIAVIAVVLQTTVLGFIGDEFFFDLLFVMVVVIGLYKDPVHGAFMAIGIGFLQDLFSPDIAGFFMATKMLVFIIAQTLKGRLSTDTPIAHFAFGLGLGLVERAAYLVLYQVFADPVALSARLVLLMLLGTVINACLVPILYFIFRLIPGFVALPRGPRVAGG